MIRGEKVTGVTTFLLQHQIDTGQILLQREMPILHEDDTGNVHDRMMMIGAGLVVASADLISLGQYQLYNQDESKATHAPKIHHEDGHIRWESTALNIYNLIRGMSPYPGAWAILDGVECKIWKSVIYSAEQTQEEFFFQMPFYLMDLLWYAFENNFDAEEVGEVVEMTGKEVQGVFNGFVRKIKTTDYLRMSPIKY